jgi:hypothetical protein
VEPDHVVIGTDVEHGRLATLVMDNFRVGIGEGLASVRDMDGVILPEEVEGLAI